MSSVPNSAPKSWVAPSSWVGWLSRSSPDSGPGGFGPLMSACPSPLHHRDVRERADLAAGGAAVAPRAPSSVTETTTVSISSGSAVLQSRIWAAVEERPGHTFDEIAARDVLRG